MKNNGVFELSGVAFRLAPPYDGLLSLVCQIFFWFIYLGASEMLMANAVCQLAAKTPGKEAIAIESFAKALRMVTDIINFT